MLIKLSDLVYVAAAEVASLVVNTHGTGITVRMRDGETHWVGNDYGKSVYETQTRLAREINAQLRPPTEA
jgi:hypothetical protein